MSEPTPIDAMKEAAERGLTLSANGQKLRVTPAERLTPEFAETLRQHKWHLLTMLRWPFCIVYSKTLEQTIFFAEDEDTKAALIEAGADSFAIYTKAELRVLVAQNRIAPLSADELLRFHSARRLFNGRIAK